LLFLALFFFAGAPQARTIAIPFRDAGDGLILVDLKINGKPRVMLLDSGASVTLFSNAAVHSAISIELEPGRVLGIRAEDTGKIGVTSLKLPKNFPHIDGILGQDFLRCFAAVRIDYRTKTIELEQK
jgi:hypothetical protein